LSEGENQLPDYAEIWNMFPNRVKLHTSGHASSDCLAEVCRLVNPAAGIIPIHSRQSDDYRNLPIDDALKEKIITKSKTIRDMEIKIIDKETNVKNIPNNVISFDEARKRFTERSKQVKFKFLNDMNDKETKSVFELSIIEYGHYDEENPLQYPSFEVSEDMIGMYSTLEKAVQGMKDYIEDGHERLFGFWIVEYDLDKFCYGWKKSDRNYLPDGSLWDECLTSRVPGDEGDTEEFFGRPADRLRFHPGDLAEVLYGDTVTLEIVGATSQTPEKLNKLKIRYEERSGRPYRSEWLDDLYYTMPVSDDETDHSHPSPTAMFPVRFPVSDEIRTHLEERYKKYLSYF
jgi:hypothetical protein